MSRVDGLVVDPVPDSSSLGRVPAPAGSLCWEIHYWQCTASVYRKERAVGRPVGEPMTPLEGERVDVGVYTVYPTLRR